MAKITFILGGARSGKSAYALKIAKNMGASVAFIATGEPLDREMKERIALHKDKRPKDWKTFEEPLEPVSVLKKVGAKFDVVIIDCLTLLIANLMQKGLKEAAIETKINELLSVLKKIQTQAIIVSNEVGLGIVPVNKLTRDFRDIAGRINQLVAEKADRVFFLVSGLPWRIK